MGKFKVVITDREYENIDNELRILKQIDADVYDYQLRDPHEIAKVAADADAVIFQYANITRELIEQMPKCKIIAKYATGTDGVDIAAATEHGIYYTNVLDYCTDEVSDHAMAMILAHSRRLFTYSRYVAGGNWYGKPKKVHRLRDQVVGVVGFGRIARAVVDKLKPFCDHIWAYDAFCDPKVIEDYGVVPKTFDELIEGADIISIHCPLTDDTFHMFNRTTFERMKNTAAIINVGRGAVIAQEDLVWALNRKEIIGAALDVLEHEPVEFDNPLVERNNVIITPHTAWYSLESQAQLQSTPAEEVVRVLTGELPHNLVNRDVLKVLGKA